MAQLARVLERVCAASFSIGMIADRFLASDVLHGPAANTLAGNVGEPRGLLTARASLEHRPTTVVAQWCKLRPGAEHQPQGRADLEDLLEPRERSVRITDAGPRGCDVLRRVIVAAIPLLEVVRDGRCFLLPPETRVQHGETGEWLTIR